MVSLSDFIAGEKVLCTTVAKSSQETLDFERIIAEDDKLDSLDREIAFLRRIVSQDMSGSRDYALAIAFYYKAQRLVDQAGTTTGEIAAEYLALAKSYYQKTIECLNLVRENHSDYRFSRDFAINVTHRLSQLQ
jgi:hypothetical protein